MTVLLSLGRQLLDDGEFEVALSAYDAGFEDSAARFWDYHNRARLYRIVGDYEAAMADHESALSHPIMEEEDRALLHQGRSFTHLFLGNTNHAIGDLVSAMELCRSWVVQASLWIHGIRILRGNPGDLHAAERSLQSARRAAQDIEEKLIVDIYDGNGDLEAALAHMGGDPCLECALYYYQGARDLAAGRVDEAKTWFTEARDTHGHGQPEYDLASWYLTP